MSAANRLVLAIYTILCVSTSVLWALVSLSSYTRMERDPAFEEASNDLLANDHWRVVMWDRWLFEVSIVYQEARAS